MNTFLCKKTKTSEKYSIWNCIDDTLGMNNIALERGRQESYKGQDEGVSQPRKTFYNTLGSNGSSR